MKDIIYELVNKIIDNTAYNEEYSYFEVSHISKLLDYITNLEKENKKLNNIINELEKIINDYPITSKLDSDYELICQLKDKIQELKEGK